MALPTLEEVRAFIFSGQVAWEHKLDEETSVLHSTATWKGLQLQRAVNKEAGKDYGRAEYRMAPIGTDTWTDFKVATPAGVFIPAKSA